MLTGLEKREDCEKCPTGKFCADEGKTVETGPCAAGFYCKLGDREGERERDRNTAIKRVKEWER